MRGTSGGTRSDLAAAPSTVAEGVDRLLGPVSVAWTAEAENIEPNRFAPGLWTAEAWLTNGAYLSLLGHSEEDVRTRLQEALKRLSR